MALVLTFLLGIANFAMHRAVLASRHPLLQGPGMAPLLGRVSLGAEFAMLLGALLLVAEVQRGWAVAYALYSGLNALSAWLIVTRRL